MTSTVVIIKSNALVLAQFGKPSRDNFHAVYNVCKLDINEEYDNVMALQESKLILN